MNSRLRLPVLAAIALASAGFCVAAHAEPGAAPQKMGFFVTSVGLGKGGDGLFYCFAVK